MKQATHFIVQPGWKLVLSDMGLDPDHVLRLAGLPADMFSRGPASLTVTQYGRLWQAAEESTDAESLALLFGPALSVEAFDPPIFASLCSPNLNVAMQRLSTFKKLTCPLVFTVTIEPERTTITVSCLEHEPTLPSSLFLAELVFLTQLVRRGTRQRIVPLEVVTPTLPASLEAHAEFFGIVPRKGRAVRISYSNRDAVRPFLTANESLWAFFEPELRKRLFLLDAAASTSERVKAVLLEGLPAGQYSVEFVAGQLAVSRRTLQRQLSDESACFGDILHATRRQLAMHYLKSATLSHDEIATLLGFRETSSFIRAFRGWVGITPSAYRNQAR